MTPAELAAYVGAAAWLPQLATYGYQIFTKPKLSIIPARTFELSYTSFGPVFNVVAAISASRRDAVIHDIEVHIRHGKGDERVFRWSGMRESLSQAQSLTTGEVAEYSKWQPAIALKVPTSSLTEKRFFFIDPEYDEGATEHRDKLLDQHRYLRSQPGYSIALWRASKEYVSAKEYFATGMYWREGRYELTVAIRDTARNKPQCFAYWFTLTAVDVERLSQNALRFESFSDEILQSAGLVDAEAEKDGSPSDGDATVTVGWNWASPRLRSAARD